MTTFEELAAEGEAVPTEGWDFSWFEGRATEEPTPWRYASLLGDRVARARAALDLQTGGGEYLAAAVRGTPPPLLAATESWPPNAALARRTLAPLSATVAEVAESDDLPFPDGHVDLVVSRHPTVTRWDEVRRVLRPGGAYLAQHVGPGSVRELAEFLTGPRDEEEAVERETGRAGPRDEEQEPGSHHPCATTPAHSARRHAATATAAGLEVTDVREAALRMEFHDIAAVVHFLRKVVWTVPGFTVDAHRDRLAALHASIERDGSFVAHSRRVLIEARRPI